VLARRPERAAALVERVRGWLPVPIEAGALADGGSAMAEATLVLNATHLGVHPGDPSPVPREVLRPGLLIYDIAYSRNGLNRLQSSALSAGALVCDGLAHLFEQAPITFRMLTGHEAPRELMRASLVAATGHRPLDWGLDPTDGTRQRESEESSSVLPSR
jgi:shikimate 5-dehydrogenase